MAQAATSPSTTTDAAGALVDVIVTGVGRATPVAARSIAAGLGLPIERVVGALYRAPSRLAAGVAARTAGALVDLLRSIGLDAEARESGAPLEATALYDVAIDLGQPARIGEVAQEVAAFTGMGIDQAREALLTPPGVLLGGIGQAAVDALAQRLDGLGADVVAERCGTGSYMLIGAGLPDVVRASLVADLTQAGAAFQDRGDSLIADGIAHDDATRIWRRHRGGDAIRLVNRAFLRFDIRLLGTGGLAPAAFGDALARIAGIPADLADDLATALPIVIEARVPADGLAERLAAWQDAALPVEASLVTFRHYAVELAAIGDEAATREVLQVHGLTGAGNRLPPCPTLLPHRLPEPRARVVQALLEQAGAEAYLVEDAADV